MNLHPETKKALAVFSFFGMLHFVSYKLFALSFYFAPDPFTYTYPMLVVMKKALLAGEIPFWNPHIFFGEPLLFSGSYDPKILLLLPWMSVMDAMVLHASLYFIVGGVVFCKFARELFGFSFLPTLVGGFVFILNGYLVCFLYDGPYQSLTLWIPLQILALLRLGSDRRWSIPILSLCMADQISTGRFDSVELAFVGVLGFGMAYEVAEGKFQWRRWLTQTLPLFFASFGLALLLVAPFFVDQMYAIWDSKRFTGVIDVNQYTFSVLNFFNLLPERLGFSPWAIGAGEVNFIGFLGLFLLMIALFYRKERRRILIFLGIAALANLFVYRTDAIFGINFYRMFYKSLPGHAGLSTTVRFLPIAYLFLSVVMMDGAEYLTHLLNGPRSKTLRILGVGLTALILVVGLYCFKNMRALVPEPHQNVAQVGFRKLTFQILLALQGIFFVTFIFFVKRPRVVLGTWVMLHALSMWIVNLNMGGGHPASFYRPFLEKGKYETYLASFSGAPSESRVLHTDEEIEGMMGVNISLGLHSPGGYYVAVEKDKADFLKEIVGAHYVGHGEIKFDEQTKNFSGYELSNVRYYLFRMREYVDEPTFNPEKSILSPVASFPHLKMKIFEDKNVIPRVQMVKTFSLVSQEKRLEILKELTKEKVSWFKQSAVIEVSAQKARAFEIDPTKALGSAKTAHYSNNRVQVDIVTESGGILVFSDYFDPFRWRVFLDSKETEMFRTNGIFRGVYIPTGNHKVEFRYYFPFWVLMLSLMGIAILFWTVYSTEPVIQYKSGPNRF